MQVKIFTGVPDEIEFQINRWLETMPTNMVIKNIKQTTKYGGKFSTQSIVISIWW